MTKKAGISLVVETPSEKRRREWQAIRDYRKLLAAYDLPAIPNPEQDKKVSIKV